MTQSSDRRWHDGIAPRILLGAILPACVLAAWWIGTRSGSAVVPGFGEVFHVLMNPTEEPPDLSSRSLAFSTGLSLLRLSLGYLLALATAVPLGLWAGRNAIVEKILEPAVELARPINPIVLLPILTVLLGVSSLGSALYGATEAWRHDVLEQVQTAVVLILWYGAFFPIYTGALHGARSVRTSFIESFSLLKAGRWETFRWVILPHSLPHIASGMRVALGTSWLVIVAAEIFPGTRSGLGYMLCTACKTSEYEYTFAAILVIGATGLLTNGLLRRFERRVGHWVAAER